MFCHSSETVVLMEMPLQEIPTGKTPTNLLSRHIFT